MNPWSKAFTHADCNVFARLGWNPRLNTLSFRYKAHWSSKYFSTILTLCVNSWHRGHHSNLHIEYNILTCIFSAM